MSKQITIYVDTSDDAMGLAYNPKMDVAESIEKFTDAIIEAVEAKYPEYSVRLHTTEWRNEAVFDDGRDEVDDALELENDSDDVMSIVSDVYIETDKWYAEIATEEGDYETADYQIEQDGIIYDCDAVIVNSEGEWAAVWNGEGADHVQDNGEYIEAPKNWRKLIVGTA